MAREERIARYTDAGRGAPRARAPFLGLHPSRCFFLLLASACSAPLAGQAVRDTAAAPRAEHGQVKLVPRIPAGGPALKLDFPAVHIGVAEYDEGPTGATVFHFPAGVRAAVDVRGGAAGTIGTDFLRLGYESQFIDAIVFAGGSTYGLAAATGVASELKTRREDAGEWGNIATVLGAIIFDLGARRFTAVTPDEELGRAALRAAEPGRFPFGARGAGRFAMQSGWFDSGRFARQGGFYDMRQHSGQGAAFRQVGPTKIAVFTVVNSLGAVVDRAGRVVRCGNEPARACGTIAELLARTVEQRASAAAERSAGGEATTLTLVVTNQRLPFWALQRLAVQVHASMARAIQPFHTQQDGDVLFAVSTAEVDNAALSPVNLAVIASEVAWDAVLASVPPLPAVDTARVRVAPAQLTALAGVYRFGPRAELTIAAQGDRLFATATGGRAVYGFAPEERVELFPRSPTEFWTRNVRRDRLRFERQADGSGRAVVLNPGAWALRAERAR